MPARSEVSITDINHFKAIANVDHIDMNADVERNEVNNRTLPHPPKQEKLTQNAMGVKMDSIKEDDASSSSEGEVVIPSSRKQNGHRPPQRPQNTQRNRKTPLSQKKGRDSSSSDESSSGGYSSSEGSDSSSSASRHRRRPRPPPPPSSSSVASQHHHHTVSAPPPSLPRQSKQDLLFELDRIAQTKELSRRFTMEDDYGDIEDEVLRHRQAESDTSMLLIMREGLVALSVGVEMANSKIGLLELDGWSESVSEEREKFDPVLLRIKQKYMRSAILQPEAELAFLLSSSAVSYHLKTKSRKHEAEVRRNRRKKKAKDVDVASSDDESVPTAASS